MSVGYLVSVWLHILAAAVWVGGMAFIAFAAMPALQAEAPAERRRLLGAIALRFRPVAWVAVGTLFVTGVTQLGLGPRPLAAYSGPFGIFLAAKLTLVFVAVGVTAFHDFDLGPRALELAESPEGERLRRAASWFGRIAFLLATLVVAIAVTMVRAS